MTWCKWPTGSSVTWNRRPASRGKREAEHAAGHAAAKFEAAGGVDLTAECDQATLSHTLEEAIRSEAWMKSQATAAEQAAKARTDAKEKLSDAEAAYQGPTASDALDAEHEWAHVVDGCNEAVRSAEALTAARSRQQQANTSLAAAIRERKAAEAHEQTIAASRKQLAADLRFPFRLNASMRSANRRQGPPRRSSRAP